MSIDSNRESMKRAIGPEKQHSSVQQSIDIVVV